MPSSIFSSDGAPPPDVDVAFCRREIPAQSWGRLTLTALVIALTLAFVAEVALRMCGHRPTADGEDLDLWAAERRRASNNDESTAVIIGKSRAQLDFDVATLRARHPDLTWIQLALRGRGAFAVFRDLVEDPRFRGRILFSLTEEDLVVDVENAQAEAVWRSKNAGPDDIGNARLRALLSSLLTIRSSLLTPARFLRDIGRGDPVIPNFIVVEPDRFSSADFTRVNPEWVLRDVLAVQQRAYARMGDMETPLYPWANDIRRVQPLIDTLRQRGGDVAFLHLPVSGPSAEFSERFFPKARFWDHFAKNVRAVTIHYRDVPTLQGFECPDSSHLDQRDAPRFTLALLKALERRSFLPLQGF